VCPKQDLKVPYNWSLESINLAFLIFPFFYTRINNQSFIKNQQNLNMGKPWETYKNDIYRLYILESKSLEQVKNILSKTHGFEAW